MANGKWVLHYAALNNDADVQVLEFSSKRKRLNGNSGVSISIFKMHFSQQRH
jgi:hypothetical protein